MPTSSSGHLYKLHQLWQAVILKLFKLEECTLLFWKPPIFINLVPEGQGYSCMFNTWKSVLKMDRFITVYLVAGYITIWLSEIQSATFVYTQPMFCCSKFFMLHYIDTFYNTNQSIFPKFSINIKMILKPLKPFKINKNSRSKSTLEACEWQEEDIRRKMYASAATTGEMQSLALSAQ